MERAGYGARGNEWRGKADRPAEHAPIHETDPPLITGQSPRSDRDISPILATKTSRGIDPIPSTLGRTTLHSSTTIS